MARQAQVEAVIADDLAAPQLPDLLDSLDRPPVVLVPGSERPVLSNARLLTKADALAASADTTPVPVNSDNLAYLLFTSGSTGWPKGVPITHDNVRAFLEYNQKRYGIKPSDRFSQTFDQTFDLSVFDLFMAWEHGAAVCGMSPIEVLSPTRYLEQNNVTVWFSVPSVAAVLSKRGALVPGAMPSLRWSLFCGEPLRRTTAEAWQAAAPNSIVENLYGPTELTIACAVHRWDPRSSPALCVHDNVPIGQVYPSLQALVVDDALRPLSDGAAGELCVAGPQVTPGYWREPDLTAERFFLRDGRRYYRTGDVVRRTGDQYAYLGRTDQQVKIGGYRIELGEIEAALRGAGAVEAVCLLLPDRNTIAAVVSGSASTTAELREAVAAQLPAYMVPRSIHLIDQLPLTSNGKIDRSALAARLSAGCDQSTEAPPAPTEAPPAPTEAPPAPTEAQPDTVEALIASTLDIPLAQVTETLEYQSIEQWDSLGHVALMVALEQAFGRPTEDELTVELRSVAAIKQFAARQPASASGSVDAEPRSVVRRGLEGIAFDRTEITHIDGAAGVLEHRGYNIHDLALHASYEEVAHLLLFGDLPGPVQRRAFTQELAARRRLPQPVLDLLRSLRHAHPMDALLAAVPALQAYGPARIGAQDESYDLARSVGIGLIAAVPMLVAAHHAYREGREFVAPPAHLPHAEAFLTALSGTEPTPAAARFINMCFVLHADHSSNASAFVSRVVTSCRAGMNPSITAAIAAFGGSVHGGAAERAVSLVDQVGAPENAERFVAETFDRNRPVMGFGHRVYRTEDPRVRHLRSIVMELSRERRDDSGLRILDAVAAAMQPYRRHGLAPNVDLYAGLAYRLLGLPDDIAVPMFVNGRTAGWVAQVLEQHANNVLIRPLLEYVGPHGRRFPAVSRPIDQSA